MFEPSFFAPAQEVAPAAGGQPGDETLFVLFYRAPRHNEAKSQAAGRPIFDEIEMVRITVPNAKDEVDKPVTDVERARFASKYSLFRAKGAQGLAGTPLEEWPGLSVTQIAELKAFGIRTVEGLAEMPEHHSAMFVGGAELVARAQAFLDYAKDSATAGRLAAEVVRLAAALKASEATVAQLSHRIATLEAARAV